MKISSAIFLNQKLYLLKINQIWKQKTVRLCLEGTTQRSCYTIRLFDKLIWRKIESEQRTIGIDCDACDCVCVTDQRSNSPEFNTIEKKRNENKEERKDTLLTFEDIIRDLRNKPFLSSSNNKVASIYFWLAHQRFRLSL